MAKANLSIEQMRAAITKLQKRMAELQAVDASNVTNANDPAIGSLEKKLGDILSELYSGTSDWHRFRWHALIDATYRMGYESNQFAMRQNLRQNIEREVANLNTIIELFHEKIAEGEDSPAAKARRTFAGLALHPDIDRHCTKLFEDRHYAQAVENACKVLEMLVKMRSLKDEASGTGLMQAAFNVSKPVLKFNDLQSESERSEQQGMMYLYAGAIAAFRNPRAHGLIE